MTTTGTMCSSQVREGIKKKKKKKKKTKRIRGEKKKKNMGKKSL